MKTLVVFALLCGVVTLAMPHIKLNLHTHAKRGQNQGGGRGNDKCRPILDFLKDELDKLDFSDPDTLTDFGKFLDELDESGESDQQENQQENQQEENDATKRVLQKLTSLKKNKLRELLEELVGTKSRRRRSVNIRQVSDDADDMTEEEFGMCLMKGLRKAALKAVSEETCNAQDWSGVDWSSMENLSDDSSGEDFMESILTVADQVSLPQAAACVIIFVDNHMRGQGRCAAIFAFAQAQIDALDFNTLETASESISAFGQVIEAAAASVSTTRETKRVLQKLTSLKKDKLRSMLEALAGTNGKSRKRRSINIHARGQGSNAADNQEPSEGEIVMCLMNILGEAASRVVPLDNIQGTCFPNNGEDWEGLDWCPMKTLPEGATAVQFFDSIIAMWTQLNQKNSQIPAPACVIYMVHYLVEMENQNRDKCDKIMTDNLKALVGSLVFDASLDLGPIAEAMDELTNRDKKSKTKKEEIRGLLRELLGEKEEKKRQRASPEDIAECVLGAVAIAAIENKCPAPENHSTEKVKSYICNLQGETEFTFVDFFVAARDYMVQFDSDGACGYLYVMGFLGELEKNLRDPEYCSAEANECV